MGPEEDQENIEPSGGTPNPKVLTSPQGYVLSLSGCVPFSHLLGKLKIRSMGRAVGFPGSTGKENEPLQEWKQPDPGSP